MNRPPTSPVAKRAVLWTAAAALTAAAGACASSAESNRALPSWFVEQQAALEKEGYPRLENVPDRVDATVDQGHWDAVTRDLDAAAAEMLNDPRSEAAAATAAADAEAAAFADAARQELDATRAAHGGVPAATVPPSDPAAAPADPAAVPPPPAPAQDASTPE